MMLVAVPVLLKAEGHVRQAEHQTLVMVMVPVSWQYGSVGKAQGKAIGGAKRGCWCKTKDAIPWLVNYKHNVDHCKALTSSVERSSMPVARSFVS